MRKLQCHNGLIIYQDNKGEIKLKKIENFHVTSEFLLTSSINEIIDEINNLNNKTRLLTEQLELIEKEMKKIDSKTNHI